MIKNALKRPLNVTIVLTSMCSLSVNKILVTQSAKVCIFPIIIAGEGHQLLFVALGRATIFKADSGEGYNFLIKSFCKISRPPPPVINDRSLTNRLLAQVTQQFQD